MLLLQQGTSRPTGCSRWCRHYDGNLSRINGPMMHESYEKLVQIGRPAVSAPIAEMSCDAQHIGLRSARDKQIRKPGPSCHQV